MAGDAGGWIEELLAEAAGPSTLRTPMGRRRPALLGGPGPSHPVRTRVVGTPRSRRYTGRWMRSTDARRMVARGSVYVDFFVDEAAVIFGVFRGLIPDAIPFLEQRGFTRRNSSSSTGGCSSSSRLPDGRPSWRAARWAEFQAEVRACILACGAQRRRRRIDASGRPRRPGARSRTATSIISTGCSTRPWCAGANRRRRILGCRRRAAVRRRYEKFDVARNPWSDSLWTNVYLAFEAMRGHLVGPERDGTMEFTEDAERFTWRFDPCGSGGRSMRGDAIEGSPPRMESPFELRGHEGSLRLCLEQEGRVLLLRQLLCRDAAHADRYVRVSGPRRGAADLPRYARGEVRVACLQGPGRRAGALLPRCRTTKPTDLGEPARSRPSAIACGSVSPASATGPGRRTFPPSRATRTPNSSRWPTLIARNLERSARRYGVEACFDDPAAMLAECELDALIVAAPHRYHYEIALDAVGRGVHVLVEKPLVLEPADGRR